MVQLILILIAAAFVNNVVLSQFLGLCPFLGVSKKTGTAAGMGAAIIFVITLSSALCSLVYGFILKPLGLEYLKTIVFILLIACLVQFVEMVLKKHSPSLYNSLGVYLPLITTNCAVLGITLINVQEEYDFITSIISGFGTAVGFTVIIVIMAGVRERIEHNDIPKAFQGYPIVLIAAGLMAIAFLGFAGII
ncbi:MAG: electron transport complex, RnfABCDGE type, subunit [Anaerocolumna sp.]|jgi:electron transport complex protein RnfA|nr:electron transport complex, RnfABCDGE type, subunit [Anaerocolumna sp.]